MAYKSAPRGARATLLRNPVRDAILAVLLLADLAVLNERVETALHGPAAGILEGVNDVRDTVGLAGIHFSVHLLGRRFSRLPGHTIGLRVGHDYTCPMWGNVLHSSPHSA